MSLMASCLSQRKPLKKYLAAILDFPPLVKVSSSFDTQNVIVIYRNTSAVFVDAVIWTARSPWNDPGAVRPRYVINTCHIMYVNK